MEKKKKMVGEINTLEAKLTIMFQDFKDEMRADLIQ